MKLRVLGSAAGGGFPQWNCSCRNCNGVRSGTLRASARTQSSIAISDDASHAVLVNASPDILSQLHAVPAVQPARPARDTALQAIMLVDGQIDHTIGLFMLREASNPWPVWCTDSVYADLTQGNPILRVLGHYCGSNHRRIELRQWFEIDAVHCIRWRATPLRSKPAPYSPNRDSPQAGDNIALTIQNMRNGRTIFYAPGLGAMDDETWNAMAIADCVLVDGTFWRDEEMIDQELSTKTARSMGHLPQSGPGGMIEWLDKLPATTRKVLTHVNNSNPILDEDSQERAELNGYGIEVAYDGMEIPL